MSCRTGMSLNEEWSREYVSRQRKARSIGLYSGWVSVKNSFDMFQRSTACSNWFWVLCRSDFVIESLHVFHGELTCCRFEHKVSASKC